MDFTRASTGLDAAEFGRVLGRFKALAWDEITEAGGRLVKLVGDEAMFVAPADGRAADAALAILSQCGRDELPRARCGIAAGKVLIRGGDYFGPVVNLASRLVDAAAPDAVVLDSGYRQILVDQRPDLPVAELESREFKGIGPTELWAVRMGDVPRFGPAR